MRQSAASGAARVTALDIERAHESGARRPIVEAQAAHPFLHDLRVPQVGQSIEEILAGLAQMAPFRMRVQLSETFGEGPATTKGNAQIVHGPHGEAVERERLFGSDAAQGTLQRTRRKRKVCGTIRSLRRHGGVTG